MFTAVAFGWRDKARVDRPYEVAYFRERWPTDTRLAQ